MDYIDLMPQIDEYAIVDYLNEPLEDVVTRCQAAIRSEQYSWSQIGKTYLKDLREHIKSNPDDILCRLIIEDIVAQAWDLETNWKKDENGEYVAVDSYTGEIVPDIYPKLPDDKCMEIDLLTGENSRFGQIPVSQKPRFLTGKYKGNSSLAEVIASWYEEHGLAYMAEEAIKASSEGYASDYYPEYEYENDPEDHGFHTKEYLRRKHIYPQEDTTISMKLMEEFDAQMKPYWDSLFKELHETWKIKGAAQRNAAKKDAMHQYAVPLVRKLNVMAREWPVMYIAKHFMRLNGLFTKHRNQFIPLINLLTNHLVNQDGEDEYTVEQYIRTYGVYDQEEVISDAWSYTPDESMYTNTLERIAAEFMEEYINSMSNDPTEEAPKSRIFNMEYMRAVLNNEGNPNESAWKKWWEWQYRLYPEAAKQREQQLKNGMNIIDANKAFYRARKTFTIVIYTPKYITIDYYGQHKNIYPAYADKLRGKLRIPKGCKSKFTKAVIAFLKSAHVSKDGHLIKGWTTRELCTLISK